MDNIKLKRLKEEQIIKEYYCKDCPFLSNCKATRNEKTNKLKCPMGYWEEEQQLDSQTD